MNPVNDFAIQLANKSKHCFAHWNRIDLHNHTPSSYDYQYLESDVVQKTAERIVACNLSVVMFTDHEHLPNKEFISSIQAILDERGHKALLLSGVELNVFVEGFNFDEKKYSDSHCFYHMLVGFDPNNLRSPDYWLQNVYQDCGEVNHVIGDRTFRGISKPLDSLCESLKGSNALIIPAHLHTNKDLAKSRSVDDLYSDATFLKHARESFTALEVVSLKTAQFFDGKHDETNCLLKGCTRSSDSHSPEELGRRYCYAQMQDLTYDDLKAALELPSRISLDVMPEPDCYIAGVHISGAFLNDQWLELSPHCNVLIGVKGSGKTSVLEALRFVLGADIPQTRSSEVNTHLQSILGSTGKVTALVKRSDGTRLLVSRSLADRTFEITFEDSRIERLANPDALHFPIQVLGWHEIEQAANDSNVRRVYMDAIAGRAKVRRLENEANTLASRVKDLHESATVKYKLYSDLVVEVSRLEELRRGLQTLTDNSLIELRNQYQQAADQRQALLEVIATLRNTNQSIGKVMSDIAPLPSTPLPEFATPIDSTLSVARNLLTTFRESIDQQSSIMQSIVADTLSALEQQQIIVEEKFQEFLRNYNSELEQLTPEQRRILESHREVLEQTRMLSTRQVERDNERRQLESLLRQLVDMCDRLANTLDERTELRRTAVEKLNIVLASSGVRLEIDPQELSNEYTQLSTQYQDGARKIEALRSQHNARRLHLSLKNAYSQFLSGFDPNLAPLLFGSIEIALIILKYETDDLKISLKIGRPGQEFSPIHQLSAGQKCTAIFPILLSLQDGPLVVDQPEDNLDNRYIASFIAESLRDNKRKRQMVFTSHNANLVVLSDAESIMLFESDGTVGKLDLQGFFAHDKSLIRKAVVDVLDGGENAIRLRSLKYGLQRN